MQSNFEWTKITVGQNNQKCLISIFMAKFKYLGLGELGFNYENNRVARFARNVVKRDFLSNFSTTVLTYPIPQIIC